MKHLLSLILLFTTVIMSSQTAELNAPYIGTWEYQKGNQIFRLTIWQDHIANPYDGVKYLNGHYEMIDISTGSPQTMYTSNPPELSTQNKVLHAFNGTIHQQTDLSMTFGGTFRQIHTGGAGIRGDFTIRLLSTCPTCPKKIHWKVTKKIETRVVSEGQSLTTDIVVPTDIELTKVQ